MRNIDEWINKLSNEDSLIVVEGKKDKIALNRLGIENIYLINKPIYSLIDMLTEKNKEIVILTDLDKEGRKLYHKLKKGFQRNGIKVNDRYRKYLFKCKISHIQGLFAYYRNNSREAL